MNELALFAGAGGGVLGGHLLGWRCVCAVECEPYAAGILLARQNDGLLPPFPIWDDVRTFDGAPWRGAVDVVSAGFPCQDISAAGSGKGLDGERSGLWLEAKRIIREVGPAHVFLENSPILTSRGLGRVLGDLASMGFDAKWGVLGAADVGAPHIRDRIWIVAHANAQRLQERPLHARSESQARCPSEGEDAALDSRWPGEPDKMERLMAMHERMQAREAETAWNEAMAACQRELRQVAPVWCEWFMGWPEGWTALKPLATDRFHEWQRQHGGCSPE